MHIFLLWLGAIQCREQSKQNDVVEIAELGRERYEMLLEKFRIGPVMLHQFYANILAETLKDYEVAMEHRVLAVSMEAKGWSLYGMGNTLLGMKNYEWASAVLARTVRTNPYNAKYVNRWGDALYHLKRYGEAEMKYRTAVRLDPKKSFWWDDLGDCLKKQGKYDEGFECFQRALELGGDVLDSLAYCYHFGQGVDKDEEKAFELYGQYKENHPESTWGLYKLGFCYSNGIGVEKDSSQALAYFEEVLQIDPDHSDGLNSLAWELATCEDASLHDFPRAIELVKRSIALNENGHNLDTLTVAYFDSGQYGKALASVKYLIQFHQTQNPENPVPEYLVKRLAQYKKALLESGGAL